MKVHAGIAGLATLLLLSSVMLAGCSVVRFDGMSGQAGRVVSLDASDRVLLVTRASAPVGSAGEKFKACIEQSPDAFLTRSGSGSASVETKGVAAQLAIAMAEAGMSLAFRTQVTQAQSNLLFNLCQLNANGALSDNAVRTEIRRFQHGLLGMIAIEQLTAPIRGGGQPYVLSTSSASAGKDVEVAQQLLKQEEEKLGELSAAVKTEEANLEKIDSKDEAKKAEREKQEAVVAKAKEEVEKQKKAVAIAQERLNAARLAVSVAAGGAAGPINVVMPKSGSEMPEHVAQAVSGVVSDVLTRGVLLDACVEARLEPDRSAWATGGAGALDVCERAVKAYLSQFEAQVKVVAAGARLNEEIASALARCAGTPNLDFCKNLAGSLGRVATPDGS